MNTPGIVSLILTIVAAIFLVCSAAGTTSKSFKTLKDVGWAKMEDGPMGLYTGTVVYCSGTSSSNSCHWFSDLIGTEDKFESSGNTVAVFLWATTIIVAAVKIPFAASAMCAKPCCGCGCPTNMVLGIVSVILLLLSIIIFSANVYDSKEFKAFASQSAIDKEHGPGFALAIVSMVLLVIDAPLAFLGHSHALANAAQGGASGAQMTPVTITTAK